MCLFNLIFNSCRLSDDKTEEYIAIHDKDTAYLTISFYEDVFQGKMIIKGFRDDIENGSIRGKISGDILIGDFLYKPYKAQKRKALSFCT